jgi:hypothetical protein
MFNIHHLLLHDIDIFNNILLFNIVIIPNRMSAGGGRTPQRCLLPILQVIEHYDLSSLRWWEWQEG